MVGPQDLQISLPIAPIAPIEVPNVLCSQLWIYQHDLVCLLIPVPGVRRRHALGPPSSSTSPQPPQDDPDVEERPHGVSGSFTWREI